ncbi:CMGC/CDK/CDC2 protein kinase [Dirofilaria immitis]|nr:CMGC/CDK/CDC2 protein kinase [Dirofilaria immitis]
MSTPTEDIWHGVTQLPDFKMSFPQWKEDGLRKILDSYMDPEGIEILRDMLIYDPAQRISAKKLLKNPYFDDVDRTKLPAGDYDGTLVLPPRYVKVLPKFYGVYKALFQASGCSQVWQERRNEMQWRGSGARRFLLNDTKENNLDSANAGRHLAEMLKITNFNVSGTDESYLKNNVTYIAKNLFSNTIVNGERTTTISLLSLSNDIDLPIFHNYKDTEQLTYKTGLQSDKDREYLKWDGNLKDGGGKTKQEVEIEDIVHGTLEKRIQRFLVWTAPGIGMFCGSFFTCSLLRSFGSGRFFAVMMIISAMATALLAMAPQFKYGRYLAACMRFIQGLAFSNVFPMISIVTANWGTLKHQFLFLVCCTCFIQLAPLISWPTSSFMFAHDYRIPFLVHAAATCLLALVWLVVFRERPQYHFSVNGLELNKIVAGKIKAEHNRVLAENPCRSLILSFPVWAIWIASCGYFLWYRLLFIYNDAVSWIMVSLSEAFSEKISILVFNTISFIICALIFIFLAMFPPSDTFHHSGFAFFFTAAAVVFLWKKSRNANEWRVIFLMLAAFLLISAAVFGIFGSASPEEWSKDSWDPSAARPMITFDQIDYHVEECGILEMRILK